MAVRKKTSKKSAKSSASKKRASQKKVAKKAAKKKVVKKRPSTKKAAKKKAAKKKVSKKKTVAKKTATKKKAAPKKAAKKPATPKKVVKKTAASKAARKVAKPAAPKKPLARSKITRADIKGKSAINGPIHGIEAYQPKVGEEYMNDAQLEHFREILLAWKHELMHEVDRTVHHMQDEASNFPDPNDRATQESEFGLELRTRDRERKLLRKIEQALGRVDDASYGFCEETGEEIGLKRLEARPVATLCVEAQERREVSEKQYRDHDDRYR
jgi:DnaK suppressor protein